MCSLVSKREELLQNKGIYKSHPKAECYGKYAIGTLLLRYHNYDKFYYIGATTH